MTTIPASTQLAVALFNAEIDGGDAGTRPMRGAAIPTGAVVLDAVVRIDVPFVCAKPLGKLTRQSTPHLAIRVGDGLIVPPLTLGHQSWRAGRVKRAELAATGSTVVCPEEQELTVAVAPTGSGGFSRGALTAVVSYIVMPELP